MTPFSGWVKLHREYRERAVFKDARLWQFFCWCLFAAEYKQTEILVGYDTVVLQPGQFLFGKPGRRLASQETGLSDQTLKTFVKKLSSGPNPLISEETNPAYSVVTILDKRLWKSDQSETNPELTRSQPAANPELTREQPAVIGDVPSLAPRAYAPARSKEKEVKETTQITPCASDSNALFRTTYQHALNVYQEESGITAQDYNTKEGAKLLAQAVVEGELEAAHVNVIVKKGLMDTTLKHQGLRGIARNFTKYLPEQEIAVKETRPIVTWVCSDCGHVHRQYWTIPQEPMAIQCQSEAGCRGRMEPNIASIRASPEESGSHASHGVA